MKNKIAVFIDGGYVDKMAVHGFNEQNGCENKLDYCKLIEHAMLENGEKEYDLLRVYYYTCPPYKFENPTYEQKTFCEGRENFINKISGLNRFEVRLGRLQSIDVGDGKKKFRQKGVDIYLAADLLGLALKNKISKAVIITGDSDFVPVIQMVKEAGVVVKLYYYNSQNERGKKSGTFNYLLYYAVDERCEITLDLYKKLSL